MRISITQNITTKTHVNHAYTHTCNIQQDTAIEKPGARSALSREIADTNTHKQTTRTHMRVPMAHNQNYMYAHPHIHVQTDRRRQHIIQLCSFPPTVVTCIEFQLTHHPTPLGRPTMDVCVAVWSDPCLSPARPPLQLSLNIVQTSVS